MPTKVAVIQKPPVLLDRDKTIVRALASIDEAAREGATLLVFPEAYIPVTRPGSGVSSPAGT
jgi:nitrilase